MTFLSTKWSVKGQGTRRQVSTLHRNLLLPFVSTTDAIETDDDPNTPAEDQVANNTVRPYVIPMRRSAGSPGLLPSSRPKRTSRAPDRYGY
jgi:hypothetical protein